MTVQPISHSLGPISAPQEAIRGGAISKTTWKTYSLVVLSYLLIGIGIALAAASPYFSTFIHPFIAFSSPIVPIALGILLRQNSSAMGFFPGSNASLFIKGQPLGLFNPNVNCWMNASLQLLNNASSYKALMKDLSKKFHYGLFPLIKAFKLYQTELEEGSGRGLSSVNSAEVRKWLARVKKEIFAERTQEDPMAFFEELHNQSNKFLPIVQQKNAEKEISISEFFIPLFITPKGKNSFLELFQNYFNEYIQDSKLHLKKWFTSAPNGFLVRANRFGYDANGHEIKIKDSVNFPIQLQLTKDQCKKGNQNYSVDAFILHLGSSSTSGHYTTYVRKDGYWWHLNDSDVTQVSDREANSKIRDAYIVHYAQENSQEQAG